MSAARLAEMPLERVVSNPVFEHITLELERLDLMILRRVAQFRRELGSVERGSANAAAHISHEEIDLLLSRNEASVDGAAGTESIDQAINERSEAIGTRLADWRAEGVIPPLSALAQIFGLNPFETQCLIVCLAPELRRKYDRIYAYLQDDITRKKPSVDLILDLCCQTETERWQRRGALARSARLLRSNLLEEVEDPQSPSGSSGLSRFLNLDPRILDFILGNHRIDARLQDFAHLLDANQTLDSLAVDPASKTRLTELFDRRLSSGAAASKLLIHLKGPHGVGKKASALSICARLGCPLLVVDGGRTLQASPSGEELLKLAFRESLLLQAPIYLSNMDQALSTGARPNTAPPPLARLASEFGWLTFVAGERSCGVEEDQDLIVFESLQLTVPDLTSRQQIWLSLLANHGHSADGLDVAYLANTFRLGPGQIEDAIRSARNTNGNAQLTTEDLAAACRRLSNRSLDDLAVRVEPVYGWDDIVLPDDTIELLREICNQARQTYRVLIEWGFERKVPYGRGLSVMFSGPPGTGKTMAAQIIARELGVDLYKIDLSGVVSKYIGETEKNLSRIFAAAESSNAVIFFDEADALFGKRTEVTDAHDRYANIEISYLLQKMEEYDGVVILATNLRKNMDDAFVRRIRFIVDYAFPTEAGRLAIWRKHFPKAAPVDGDIDFDLLARKVKVPGGNIKNIVLNAAFRAAQQDTPIQMEHIVKSTRREFEKIGKLWEEKALTAETAEAKAS
jgi:SpoVK/Ycf46/Vps4 family AAA+-type ATPase